MVVKIRVPKHFGRNQLYGSALPVAIENQTDLHYKTENVPPCHPHNLCLDGMLMACLQVRLHRYHNRVYDPVSTAPNKLCVFCRCGGVKLQYCCCWQVISLGLLMEEYSYLRDGWNVLDCLVVLFSIVSLSLTSLDLTWVKTFRALRVLRPLRVINRIPELKVALRSRPPRCSTLRPTETHTCAERCHPNSIANAPHCSYQCRVPMTKHLAPTCWARHVPCLFDAGDPPSLTLLENVERARGFVSDHIRMITAHGRLWW